MKKILSVLVVFSLLLIICVPAFAGTNVDALTDPQQSEIATLVLKSVKDGNDPETIKGRSGIKSDVLGGIADMSVYKDAYNTASASISVIVSTAVSAVRDDTGFSTAASGMLTTLLTNAIIAEVAETTTTTASSGGTTTTEAATSSADTQYIVDFLSRLQYDQIEKYLVSFVGNKIITSDQAKSIANTLYVNGSITAEQRETLLKAVVSDEASTNSVEGFFEGYTPTDLSMLFRGFGDSIGSMTAALANLFRGGSSGGSETTTTPSGSGNASDIPATGDYAIPAVAAVALAAGLALVLTKKKKDS